MLVLIAHALLPLPLLPIPSSNALIFPSLHAHDWSALNKELALLLSPIHEALSADVISPSAAAESFSSTLSDFFLSTPEFNSIPCDYFNRTAKALKKARKQKKARPPGLLMYTQLSFSLLF